MLGYWNTGILEYWNNGISVGILECWNTGIVEKPRLLGSVGSK
jgi:hypothetical protein